MRKFAHYLGSLALALSLVLTVTGFAAHATTPFPYGNDASVSSPGTGLSAGLDRLETKIDEGNSGIIQEDSLKKLVNNWTSYFLQYYMVVAVGIVIYLGVRMVMSQGAEDQRKKTIQAFVNLAIGTAIIFLSYVIVNQVVSIISPDTPSATEALIRANTRTSGTSAPGGTTSTTTPPATTTP